MRRHYVRGHFRGGIPLTKKRYHKDPFGFLITPIMLIIFLAFIGWVLKELWGVILPLALIFIALYIFIRVRRKRKAQRDLMELQRDLGRYYTTRKICPNCGRWNDFRYETGKPIGGITLPCSKCGIRYG